jgi:hypothetical protein
MPELPAQSGDLPTVRSLSVTEEPLAVFAVVHKKRVSLKKVS